MVALAPHTCPDIDLAIAGFEERIDTVIDTIYQYILDNINIDADEHEELKKLLHSYKQDIITEFDSYANKVRETNEHLRDSAEDVIAYYKEQIGIYDE